MKTLEDIFKSCCSKSVLKGLDKIILKHDYFNIFINGLKERGEQISHKVKEYQYKKVLLIKGEFC